MNYKSFGDLSVDIRKNINKIPKDVTLVVGIPRSGFLAGNIISTFLNLPLTDVEGFLNKKILVSGNKNKFIDKEAFKGKILVVDDSINTGKNIAKVKKKFAGILTEYQIIYCVVYTLPGREGLVDIFLETVDSPRVFDWNILHHHVLHNAFVDLDDVICYPFEGDIKDEESYINFIKTAKPRFLPTVNLKVVVTNRSSIYRDFTTTWLLNNNIQFDELLMCNLSEKPYLINYEKQLNFKAKEYKNRKRTNLYMIFSKSQAEKIFKTSRKPVYCIETNKILQNKKIIPPGIRIFIGRIYRSLIYRVKKKDLI